MSWRNFKLESVDSPRQDLIQSSRNNSVVLGCLVLGIGVLGKLNELFAGLPALEKLRCCLLWRYGQVVRPLRLLRD